MSNGYDHNPTVLSAHCHEKVTFSTDREFYARVVDSAKRESVPACTKCFIVDPPLRERDSQGNLPPISPSDEEARHFPPDRALVRLVGFISDIGCLGPHLRQPEATTRPVVTLVVDNEHTLAEVHPRGSNLPASGWTHLTKLRQAARVLEPSSLYSLFLSTSGKIAPPERPKPVEDPSLRIISSHLNSVPPLTDLGFDQLAHQLSPDGKEIAWITVRSGIVSFAAKKLLGGIEHNAAVPVAELPTHAKLTCLAQRLPLTPNPYQSAEMAQVENHARVCLKFDPDPTRIVTVASSEPLLSEAAYRVMQNHVFDPPGALVSVLRGVMAGKGSRGELVVMLALTLARWSGWGRWAAPHTSPSELHDDVFAALGQTLSPAGAIATEVTFEDQFRDARVYFNHFIKVHEHSSPNRAHPAVLFYCGTAFAWVRGAVSRNAWGRSCGRVRTM
ncbi:hypothetical protein BJ138DRAFT_1183579, partial [Hygrophoropsis aurantiaca]